MTPLPIGQKVSYMLIYGFLRNKTNVFNRV